MSDTKRDDSSGTLQGITPVGGYGCNIPRKNPAPANFKKWARRDFWHIAEGTMLLLGFEPFPVTAYRWPKPEGFDDIYETACRSSALRGRSRTPRDFLGWAREKEYHIPEELEEAVNRFHPKAEGSPQGGAEGDAMDIHTKVPLPRQQSGLIRFGDIGEMIAAVMYPPTQTKPTVKRRYLWRDERYFSQDDIGEKEITDKPTIRDLDNFKAEREKGGVLDPDDRGQIVIGEEPDDADIGCDIRFCACVEGYSRALERAVENRDLTPLDPITLLSHPFPFGQALKNSLVALDDLKRWGESVGVAFVGSEGPPEKERPDEGCELEAKARPPQARKPRAAHEKVLHDWEKNPSRFRSAAKASVYYSDWLRDQGYQFEPRTVADWIYAHAKARGIKLR